MTLESVAVVAAVAIVPMVALMLSAFVKTSVVLALLRNALGAPQAPPGLVVTGVAFLVTAFVMAPVAGQVLDAVAPPAVVAPAGASMPPAAPPSATPTAPRVTPPTPPTASPTAPAAGTVGTAAPTAPAAGTVGTVVPAVGTAAPAAPTAPPTAAPTAPPTAPLAGRALPADAAGWSAALARAAVPVRAFLVRHSHAEDRATFVALARELRGADVADDDLLSLSAAFVTSELTEAFAIAFLVFLPFLVLDLVVGLGLGAAGLTTVSPTAVSLPLKLLLFVAVDGWRLLLAGLIRGYA